MKIEEYARKYHRSGQTVRRWVKQGRLRAVAIGRTWDVADEPPSWEAVGRARTIFAQLVAELASAGAVDTARTMADELVGSVTNRIQSGGFNG